MSDSQEKRLKDLRIRLKTELKKTSRSFFKQRTPVFIIALNTVIVKMAIPYASSSVINAALVLSSFLLFPLFMKHAKKRITKVFQNQFPLKFATVMIRVLSAYVFIFALQRGSVSVVNGIYQGMLIVSVLAGIIFLRERDDIVKKIIGTIITLAGVLLLS